MAALTPNLDLARAYLGALAPGELLTFQTFDDTAGKRPQLARILHGTLEQHAASLTRLNARHAGVYVMVNAGDGKGRAYKNVVQVRAIFADFDGAPLPERWELRPHLVVLSSPGKYHVYWLVCDLPLDEFSRVQKALAAYHGSDGSVHDLPRVMRVPDFYHCKHDPVMVELVEVNEQHHYTRAEVLTAWPNIAEALRPKETVKSTSSLPTSVNKRPPTDIAERILDTALDRYSALRTRHNGSKWLACQCWWNDLPRVDADKLAKRYAEGVSGDFDVNEVLELVEWAYTEKPPGEPWQTVRSTKGPKSYRSRIYDRMKRWRNGRA